MRYSSALFLLLQLQAAVMITSFLPAHNFRLRYLQHNKRIDLNLAAKEDDLDSLKVNVEKLSDKEKERLDFIQKLNQEADEFAKKAGFDLSSDADMEQRAIVDTNWSGMEKTNKIHELCRNLFCNS